MQSPFLGRDWFRLFAHYVAYNIGEPRWLLLYDNGEVSALLPMLDATKGKLRVLSSLANYYSPHFDIICRNSDRFATLKDLVQLSQDFFSSYDVISIAPLTPEAKGYFLSAMQNSDFYSHEYKYSINWSQGNILSFDQYWQGVSSRLRTTVKRKSKKLDQHGGFTFSIASADQLESALLDYHEVYYKSWKVPEPTPSFIDSFSVGANEQRKLRIFLLHYNNLPVAAQLWFVANGTAYIYKLAYDPDYANLSVGTLLSHFAFREIIQAESVHTIDYLTGDDSYKADWLEDRRDIYGVKFSNLKTMRGVQSAFRDLGSSFVNYLRHTKKQ